MKKAISIITISLLIMSCGGKFSFWNNEEEPVVESPDSLSVVELAEVMEHDLLERMLGNDIQSAAVLCEGSIENIISFQSIDDKSSINIYTSHLRGFIEKNSQLFKTMSAQNKTIRQFVEVVNDPFSAIVLSPTPEPEPESEEIEYYE